MAPFVLWLGDSEVWLGYLCDLSLPGLSPQGGTMFGVSACLNSEPHVLFLRQEHGTLQCPRLLGFVVDGGVQGEGIFWASPH